MTNCPKSRLRERKQKKASTTARKEGVLFQVNATFLSLILQWLEKKKANERIAALRIIETWVVQWRGKGTRIPNEKPGSGFLLGVIEKFSRDERLTSIFPNAQGSGFIGRYYIARLTG